MRWKFLLAALIIATPAFAQNPHVPLKIGVIYGNTVPGSCVVGTSPVFIDIDDGVHYECVTGSYSALPGGGGGHGDGADCAAGEIPLGVTAAGVAFGCYEPAFTDVTGTATLAQVPDNDITAGECLLSGGAGGDPAYTTCPGGAEVNDLTGTVTWDNVPDANVAGITERDEVCGTTDLSAACEINTAVIGRTQIDESLFSIQTHATDCTTFTCDAAADGLLCFEQDSNDWWVCDGPAVNWEINHDTTDNNINGANERDEVCGPTTSLTAACEIDSAVVGRLQIDEALLSMQRAATDCTALACVAGDAGEMCFEEDDDTFYICDGSGTPAWKGIGVAPDIDAVTGQDAWDTAAEKETADLTINGVEVDFHNGAAPGYPLLSGNASPPGAGCDAAAEYGRLMFDTDADTDGSVMVCTSAGWKEIDDDGGAGGFASFLFDGDTGPIQTITDGNTQFILGGTNISTVASATDTLTANLDLTGNTNDRLLYDNADALGSVSQFAYDGTNIDLSMISGDHVESNHVVIEVTNTSGTLIHKCAVVYISGTDVGPPVLPTIGIADSDTVGEMPAAGIVQADIANAADGFVVVNGTLDGLDTVTGEGWTAGDALYIEADNTTTASVDCGETLTNVKPTTSGELIQAVGRVVRVNATLGEIVIQGAGRSNDTPLDILTQSIQDVDGPGTDWSIDATGNILALTYGGIAEGNLIDKSADTTITGAWDWTNAGPFDFAGGVTATYFTADPTSTPNLLLVDLDNAGEGQILVDDAAGPDVVMTFLVDVADVRKTLFEVDGIAETNSSWAPLELSSTLAVPTNPADTGALRLDNNEAICWEAATPGTDLCLNVNAADAYVIDGLDCSAADQYLTTNASGVIACGTDNDSGGSPDIDAVTGQDAWDTAAEKETADLTFNGVEADFHNGAAAGYPLLSGNATPPGTACDAAAEYGRLMFDTDADTDGSVMVCTSAGWKEVDDDGGAGGFTSFNIDADDNDPRTILNGEEALFTGGVGIDTNTEATDEIKFTFAPGEVDAPTWGDGTGSVWTFNASGAGNDPTFSFDTDSLVITNVATFTVPNGSFSYAELQDVSNTDRFLGRDTAGAGVIEEIAQTEALAMLGVEAGAAADQADSEIKTAYENETFKAWSLLGNNTSGAAGPTEITASDLTEEAGPAALDWLFGWDAAGNMRKYDVDNLPPPAADGVGYDTVQDNGTPETQRAVLNLISGGTVTVACADSDPETDCTFTGSAHDGFEADTDCTDSVCALDDDTTTLEAADNDTTQLASTAFVQQEINGAGGTNVSCSGGQCSVASAAAATLGVIELDTDLGGSATAPTVVNVQAGAVPNGGIVAATVGAVELETAFETVNKCWEFDYDTDSITTSDEYTFTSWPTAATVTRIDCESWSGTSFTISICKGEDRGDDTCTTDMLSPATLACTTTRTVDSSPANTALTARQPVTIVVTAVSGTVTAGEICLEATID